MKKIILTAVLLFFFCQIASSQGYRVGEGDLLKIMVYDHPDLTSIVRITGAGKVNLPLIGETSVAGLTVPNIEEKVINLLSDGFLVTPHVSVFIQEYKSKKVIVMGEVNKPGLVELRGDATLIEVLSKVGGITEKAGEILYLQRKRAEAGESLDDGEQKKMAVELNSLLEGEDSFANISVFEGDSLYVPRAAFFYVNGEVQKPGPYKITKGLTVLQAITVAGGITDYALKEKIEITRKTKEGETTVKAMMEEPVLPEDIIFVPESFVYVNGEVKKPGVYRVTKELTVLKAVTLAGGFTDKASEGRIKIIRKNDNEEISIKAKSGDPVMPEDIVVVPQSFF